MNPAVLRYRLHKLRRLSLGELGWLCRAQLALLWAAVQLHVRPAGRLVSAASAAPPESPDAPAPQAAPPALRERVRRFERAVERAANHGVFRPTCLVKSVALQRMLQVHGVRGSRIRIGVRLRDGEFVAHAWVEWQGDVLGDTPGHVGGFDPLCHVDLTARR